MVLGVISDTHDKVPVLGWVFQTFHQANVQAVMHCGDWKSVQMFHDIASRCAAAGLPLYGVLGNNDHDVTGFLAAARDYPHATLAEGVLRWQAGAHTVAAYHGHHAPTLRRLQANEAGQHILLLGHTHKPRIERAAGQLVVNPGSTAFAIPRSRDWQASLAIVEATTTATAQLFFHAP